MVQLKFPSLLTCFFFVCLTPFLRLINLKKSTNTGVDDGGEIEKNANGSGPIRRCIKIFINIKISCLEIILKLI